MTEQSASTTVTITTEKGLHLRPADLIARRAAEFESAIQITKDGNSVDAKSILSLMTLAAEQGSELAINATGPDAQAAIDALAELLINDFDELHQTNVQEE